MPVRVLGLDIDADVRHAVAHTCPLRRTTNSQRPTCHSWSCCMRSSTTQARREERAPSRGRNAASAHEECGTAAFVAQLSAAQSPVPCAPQEGAAMTRHIRASSTTEAGYPPWLFGDGDERVQNPEVYCSKWRKEMIQRREFQK